MEFCQGFGLKQPEKAQEKHRASYGSPEAVQEVEEGGLRSTEGLKEWV